MSKYKVPIIYKGLSNFIIEAKDRIEAADKAMNLFKNGAPEVILGNEYEEVESVLLEAIEEIKG